MVIRLQRQGGSRQMNMLVVKVGMIAEGDENGSGNRKGSSPRSGLLNARKLMKNEFIMLDSRCCC